ncbi:hypothetical protein [Paraburkholderia tropica]|uniref:hypothetical protein n=1 Tax=Paraburkholderia tropica TaxID=92647 RepID=UPI002AB24416|nr:hypothetical protein [Paraburkholderia tropica]
MITRHLADHAETLSVNTLRSRLAALAQWHQTQGFPDPTKAPHVRKVLRGIVALHPATEKRAKPMQLAQLEKLTAWLDEQIAREADGRERLAYLSARRSRCVPADLGSQVRDRAHFWPIPGLSEA